MMNITLRGRGQTSLVKCNICPYNAPRIQRLKCHIQVTHQGLRVDCKLCNRTWIDMCRWYMMVSHILVSIVERLYVDEYKLSEHVENEHMNKPRQVYSWQSAQKNIYLRWPFLITWKPTRREKVISKQKMCTLCIILIM